MLQQTQVSTVIPYFERWLARFPDFAALAAAEEQSVLEVWQGLGYYARARNLHRAARQVVERHGGELPGDLEAIAALPGVGRYTAGAIASFAFDLPAAAVDGNIARVLARVFDYRQAIDSTSGNAWLWAAARNLLPAKGGRIHTSALMELGALVCTARKPGCLICPVRSFCATRSPEFLPVKKLRLKTVAVDEDCAWVVSQGRVLLEQQTGRRWSGLWKLPATKPARQGKPLYQAQYSFTNHRVTLRVFRQSAAGGLAPNQRWFSLGQLEKVAMAAPHRRAAEKLSHGPE